MRPRLDETIPEALAGERIDRVVALVGDISRSVAAKLIDEGVVRLDQARVTSASARVAEGQQLTVELPEAVDPRPAPDADVEFAVHHEDEHVIVIEKPAGLVVHPGAGNEDGTLVNGLVARYPEIATVGEAHRPGIVHRLDRGTSGLLVVARTAEAYTELVRQMSAHEPERIYVALVWGHPDNDAGVIDAPIGRSPRHPTRMAVSQQGRHAVTHYAVDRRFDQPRPTALMTCRLETGRTHQIRVHLRAIGHPVVGDRDYDGGRPGLDPGRPFLHARELRFAHPVTGEPIGVVAPLPPELDACLAGCS
ncbi:MAG: putative RNA pseudouridine synthase [Acidimicrobiales bacterium]|nr:MAG: putative RNA pseudouridine synthase [Acidimicrobiales bacterium]